MSSSDTSVSTYQEPEAAGGLRAGLAREVAALVVCWAAEGGPQLGEVAFLPALGAGRAWLLGRGVAQADDEGPRVTFCRQRPGINQPTAPLGGVGLSRRQLRLQPAEQGDGLTVERVGKCPMLVNGQALDFAVLRPGDTLLLRNQLLLLCVQRPPLLPPLRHYPAPSFPFGGPDSGGIVGESAAAWALRERVAFCAQSGRHVLILGESGAGKELVARSLHLLSDRAGRVLLCRNAATLPTGLIDAELFGNARNYPNPGMAERAGLIGEADGGTLFLDEIGELPAELQGHLLRVLDGGGEYQRLGEARPRRSTLRLIGATNRAATDLKHDFRARLPLQIEVPSLNQRREDIPLLVAHLLQRVAMEGGAALRRFSPQEPAGSTAAPRLQAELLEALLRHAYTLHVRELEGLLWRAMAASSGDRILLSDEVRAQLRPPVEPIADQRADPRPPPSRELAQASLAQHAGNVSRAALALGISRYALYRILRREA